MGLLPPVANAVIGQKFNGDDYREPRLYYQNYRGYPLAAYKYSFPGHTGIADHYHGAVDFEAPLGRPIVAQERCKVVQFGVDKYSYYAKYVIVQVNARCRIEHWHLNAFRSGLAVGQIIPRGGLLGYVGHSGNATGNHDHNVLKIIDLDSDGVRRQYLYNVLLFMNGGILQYDARIKPAY